MNILMEALGYQNYNGRWYVRGETIPVASEAEAADMIALHQAKRIPVPAQAKDLSPEAEPAELPDEEDPQTAKRKPPTTKRGKYLTRDARFASR